MKATVCRQEHFNAAHRLYKPDLNDTQNAEIFGKCSHPNYHGHNYNLIVKVTGEINKETGFVMDMKALKSIIKEHVIEKFDHRNLNIDVEEFQQLIPTTENIARVIWNIIRNDILCV